MEYNGQPDKPRARTLNEQPVRQRTEGATYPVPTTRGTSVVKVAAGAEAKPGAGTSAASRWMRTSQACDGRQLELELDQSRETLVGPWAEAKGGDPSAAGERPEKHGVTL